jgi:hypothetical protein
MARAIAGTADSTMTSIEISVHATADLKPETAKALAAMVVSIPAVEWERQRKAAPWLAAELDLLSAKGKCNCRSQTSEHAELCRTNDVTFSKSDTCRWRSEVSWPDSVPGFDTNGVPVDERHPSEDGHLDIEHIRALLFERDRLRNALRQQRDLLIENGLGRWAAISDAALGSTASGGVDV